MSDPYIGQIMQVAFTYAPQGWSTCAGQTVQVQQNAALFSLLGTMYGGNGSTTFLLPDLQGRLIVGVGAGQGLSPYTQGQKGGAEGVILSQQQMPSHTHTATFSPTGSVTPQPIVVTSSLSAISTPTTTTNSPASGALLTAPPNAGVSPVKIYAPAGTGSNPVNVGGLSVTATGGGGGITGGTVTNGLTGGSTAVPVIQPYLALLNCIALQGVYPPRP